MDRSDYCGVQHPETASLGNIGAGHVYCCKKVAYIDSTWHISNCLIAVKPGALKKRCIKCSGAHSNICLARHQRVFSDRVTAVAAYVDQVHNERPTTAIDIAQLIITDEDAVC